MNRGLAWTILIAIVVVGGFFRLSHINDTSLWLDEGITYYNSSANDLAGVWDKAASLDQSPPGYYFLMHEYLEVFGKNEFGFRLISVIFSLITMVFLYLLIATMFNEEAGLFSAAMLAVNTFHIGFSIEARMYGLLAMLTVMAFYFLYRAIYSEGNGSGWWAAFSLTSIAGLYVHNFYMFVLLGLGIVFLMLVWDSERPLVKVFLGILSALVVFVAYMPWLPNFLTQLSVERYWIADNHLFDVKDYLIDFSGGNLYAAFALLILSMMGVLWTFFRIRSIMKGRDVLAALSLGILAVIGIMTPLLYSLWVGPILKIRYVVYLVPIWMGLVGLGLYVLRRFSIVLPILLIGLFVWTQSPWKASAYPIELDTDYRGLVSTINEKPDTVVVHTPSIVHVINFYNQGKFNVVPFPFSDNLQEYAITPEDKGKFLDLVERKRSFYLVIKSSHETEDGLLKGWSEEICKNASEEEVRGLDVWHFSSCN